MVWDATPSGRRGRQQTYSAVAIQACLTIKVLFGLPLRQTTGFVESLLELVGLGWTVPNFSTLCRPLPGSACLHAREGAEVVAGCHSLSRLSGAFAPVGGQHGQRLFARDFDRQVAEIQIRAAILNGFTALGIPKTEAVG